MCAFVFGLAAGVRIGTRKGAAGESSDQHSVYTRNAVKCRIRNVWRMSAEEKESTSSTGSVTVSKDSIDSVVNSDGNSESAVSVEERVASELAERGIDLEQLLSPAKLIELERKIESKFDEINALKATSASESEIQSVEKEIAELKQKSNTERRMVMQGWLKNLFLSQGILGLVVGGVLAIGGDANVGHNPLSALIFGGESIPLVARVLGFWLIWMFTIPSLRARKPSRTEKAALNSAFIALPLANVLAPFVTKDPFHIWSADIVLLLSCYAYYFVFKQDPVDAPKLKGVAKWLDWGTWR
mmetsp:Transcript_3162/g.5569  ORF Transcript_3162/g.5569 Transcript_3162/m.5569 type:complete len:300 (+) Transcript_3162:78-977(+)